MFKIATTWNTTSPGRSAVEDFKRIEQRGYNERVVALTGQFASKLSEGVIRSLSVSDIADKKCPTRRDLYYGKGVNRLTPSELRRYKEKSWGRSAGNLIEKYLQEMIGSRNTRLATNKYSEINSKSPIYHGAFIGSKDRELQEMKRLETTSYGIQSGDTDWLMRLLLFNTGIELGGKMLHKTVKDGGVLRPKQIQQIVINPKTNQIGISAQAKPDFAITRLKIVGDIKTAPSFQTHYQLTCAGYAIAYENQYGNGNDINWGIIYFIPNRIPSARVRLLTNAQIYVFPISEDLRSWFLSERDSAYSQISRETVPDFPSNVEDKMRSCPYCGFKSYCISEGLVL